VHALVAVPAVLRQRRNVHLAIVAKVLPLAARRRRGLGSPSARLAARRWPLVLGGAAAGAARRHGARGKRRQRFGQRAALRVLVLEAELETRRSKIKGAREAETCGLSTDLGGRVVARFVQRRREAAVGIAADLNDTENDKGGI
jgi:hypothetical protein